MSSAPNVWEWYQFKPGDRLSEARPDFRRYTQVYRAAVQVKHADDVPDVGTVVALKLIPLPEAAPREAKDLLARCEDEVAAMRRLAGIPGVIRIYASGLARDQRPDTSKVYEVFYIAMEYVETTKERRDLRHTIKSTPGFVTARQVCEWGCELAGLLQQVHDKDIVHRDLKPMNVLVRPDGSLVLCDFGIAKTLPDGRTQVTATEAGVGTEGFMAPEQIERHGRVGRRTDVYGLGAVLYACLTRGLPPFQGRSAEVTRQILTDAPEPASRAREKLTTAASYSRGTAGDAGEQTQTTATLPTTDPEPEVLSALESIIRTCLRKRPGLRFRSMSALRGALDRALGGGYRPTRRDQVAGLLDGVYRNRDQLLHTTVLLPTVTFVVAIVALLVTLWRQAETIQEKTELARVEAEKAKKAETERAGQAEVAKQAEAESHRTTKLARVRLLQDASLDRQRAGDEGTSAVLLGVALAESNGQDPALDDALRVATTLARGRLKPLRNILEVTGGVRGCATSPDGALAAVGTDKGRVWLVDLATAELAPAQAYATGIDVKADSVSAVAADPSASRTRFAAATDGGRIHVFDVVDGKPRVVQIIHHPGQALSVSFSPPDGRFLLVAGRLGKKGQFRDPVEMAVYDPVSGVAVRRFPFTSAPHAAVLGPMAAVAGPRQGMPIGCELYTAAFSPDGEKIVAGGGLPPHPRVAVWDWNPNDPDDSAAPLNVLAQPARVFTLAFRPHHSSQLVTGDVNGEVRFWNLSMPAGQEAESLPIRHDKPVRVTAFSEDGQHLLVGGEDGSARLWDANTHLPTGQRFQHRGQVRAGAVNAKTGRIVTGDFAGDVRVWDLRPAVPAELLLHHPSPVWDATFSHDGTKVLTGCTSSLDSRGRESPGAARVWSVGGGKPAVLEHGADVMVAMFRPHSPDCVVTCGNDGNVWFWDVPTASKVGSHLSYDNQVIHAAAFDSTGTKFAYAGQGGSIRLCSADGTDPRFREERRVEHPTFSWIWNLRFNSPPPPASAGGDQGFVAAAGSVAARGPSELLLSDGGSGVRAWHPRPEGPPGDLIPPTAGRGIEGKVEVRLGDVSRSGRYVVTVGTDGRAAVWDVDRVTALLPWRPAVGADKLAAVLDRIVAPVLRGPVRRPGGEGVDAAWNALVAAVAARFLALPDPASAILLEQPHGTGQLCAAFNPAEQLVATGGPDGTVRLWNLDGTPRTQDVLRHPSAVELLAFSPNGRWLATGCRDGGLRLWAAAGGVWTGAGWYHSGPVTRVQFSQDGERLLSAGRDGVTRVVQVPRRTLGDSAAVRGHLEADAGVRVTVAGSGTTASYSAPQPITRGEFQKRRAAYPEPEIEQSAAMR